MKRFFTKLCWGTRQSWRREQAWCLKYRGLDFPWSHHHNHLDHRARRDGPSSISKPAVLDFSTKQKEYLIVKFQIGEQAGQRTDPTSVSRVVRTGKDSNGERLFDSTEFLLNKPSDCQLLFKEKFNRCCWGTKWWGRRVTRSRPGKLATSPKKPREVGHFNSTIASNRARCS